ncbi:MAG: hypothetical protein CMP48_25635 [Rickettsiales bacterium]|nr:hypothetical protein [Rickettsiales bacterium]
MYQNLYHLLYEKVQQKVFYCDYYYLLFIFIMYENFSIIYNHYLYVLELIINMHQEKRYRNSDPREKSNR